MTIRMDVKNDIFLAPSPKIGRARMDIYFFFYIYNYEARFSPATSKCPEPMSVQWASVIGRRMSPNHIPLLQDLPL